MSDLVERLRGIYRIPIMDGLGPAGGEEPDNANEFVRTFPTSPIQNEAADFIESQAAELSRLSALVAWQDIETAPRDGTPIIGAFWTIRWADSHRRGDIVRCWYQPEFGAFISSAREMTLAPGLTFEDGTSCQIHSPVIEPVTHWFPLPTPPVSQLKDTTNADK